MHCLLKAELVVKIPSRSTIIVSKFSLLYLPSCQRRRVAVDISGPAAPIPSCLKRAQHHRGRVCFPGDMIDIYVYKLSMNWFVGYRG